MPEINYKTEASLLLDPQEEHKVLLKWAKGDGTVDFHQDKDVICLTKRELANLLDKLPLIIEDLRGE